MRLAYLAVFAIGCSIHHRSQDLVDAGDTKDGPTDKDAPVTGDGPPQPDAPVADLSDVPGLVLWLDSGVGITMDQGSVVTWTDRSPAGNNAFAPQAFNEPDFVASSINNQPAIHFGVDGNPQLAVKDAPTLRFGSEDWLIAVVASFTNDPSNSGGNATDTRATLFHKGPVNRADGMGLDGNAEGGAGASGHEGQVFGASKAVNFRAPLNDGAGHLFVLRHNGDTLELRVDGHVVNSTTGVSMLDIDVTNAILIGSVAGGSFNRTDGDIAEVAAVAGAGAVSHLAVLETYLRTKYGL